MRANIYLFLLLFLTCTSPKSFAQLYSFEDGIVPSGWNISKGELTISDQKYKLGDKSLKVEWQGESVLHLSSALGLTEASRSTNGGITAWIYCSSPIKEHVVFSFKNAEGKEICRLPFFIRFTGWRCLWAKFREDMGMKPRESITSVDILLPDAEKNSVIYLDYLEFTPTVSWQKMSDAQYKVNQKDYSLIHNFIGYRNSSPDLSRAQITPANREGIETINSRLTTWYLGNGSFSHHPLVQIRRKGENSYIKKGIAAGRNIRPAYNQQDSTPIGEGLFPLYAPSKIDNRKVTSFPDINKKVLLPLALDYRKNKNRESLEKAVYIYDWFNDQGWADGSGMGTLCFEKLRSSGYFHSFYLLKEELTPLQLERELKAMKWFTMFGMCYQKPEHAGEVADNLRALAIPKLIYALSLTDEKEQQTAMAAFTAYMDNALQFGPGYFGTIKPDYSGYHHRGTYNSAYYPHALYAASLVAYLLHDTPYALSAGSIERLKQALLTYRFFSANLEVPAGTTGRFPTKQDVLQILLPAYGYVALCTKEPDKKLTAAFKRILNQHPKEMEEYAADVNSDLTYTSGLGEMELVARLEKENIQEEESPEGALFMPYSGLMVVKSKTHHFNIKGFSKYIWDYESSGTENLYGRYLSYGQLEYFGLKDKTKSFNPTNEAFDWSYIPGTTSKVLPKSVLNDTAQSRAFHRNFSDESFLCGVGHSKEEAMFSFKLHDITFDQTFRANKTVFAIENALVCMGSDIENADDNTHTVTTLFQSPNKEKKYTAIKGGYTLFADGLCFAVKGDRPTFLQNDSFQTAFIDHGKAPQKAEYLYYLVYEGGAKRAKELLSDKSPVRIIQQDKDAHIIEETKKGVVYAVIFNAQTEYKSLPVKRTNIPLSYIFKKEGGNSFTLMFCEPDMRRPTGINMGKLTEADVLQEEKPFDTEITLQGDYELGAPHPAISIKHGNGETTICVSTIRAENHIVNLVKR